MELEQNDLQRLAKLESSTESIEKLVIRMDGKLDGYAANHVTKSELAEALRWRDKEIESMKEGQVWLRRMLASAVTGGIISLITAIILLWINLSGGKP